jgi:hypothetical protein
MPDEVKYIFQNAYIITKSRINATEEIFNVAYESLQENLTDIICKLGYNKIIFESEE